ncbi:MAG: TonB-dependent receptor [Pseudomonadota bacterium]
MSSFVLVASLLFGSSAAIAKLPEAGAEMAFDGHTLPIVRVQQGTLGQELNIPATSLSDALIALSQQTGLQITAQSSSIASIRTQAVRGRLTARQALDSLLQGTGLSASRVGDVGFVVTLPPVAVAQAIELQGIVVTARRTEEDVASVPGSVVVLGGEELERSNLDSTDQIISRLPNVSFTENATPADLNISIRGISNLVGPSASAPTNGVFLDGVLLNPTDSSIAINPKLLDIERVETAFGPQGTAFGRGTIGGAINIVPRKPTDKLEGSLTAEGGSYPTGELKAILNMPLLSDGLLSARLVAFGAIDEGFIDLPNIPISSRDNNRREESGVRLSLQSKPTDRLTLFASVSTDLTEYVTANSATTESVDRGDPETLVNTVGAKNDELRRSQYTGRVSYQFDALKLISTTAYHESKIRQSGDSDNTSLDFLFGESSSTQDSFSQEFRFEGTEVALPLNAGKVSTNLGVSFSKTKGTTTNFLDPGQDAFSLIAPGLLTLGNVQNLIGLGILPAGFDLQSVADQQIQLAFFAANLTDDGSTVLTPATQDVSNFGIYGDVRWRPINPLEITVGARFSRDTVDVTGQTVSSGLTSAVFPTIASFENEESFTAITPNASIRYQWNDNLSTYFSFSTGYRPGGFSTNLVGTQSFDEEKAKSYEIGFKSSWFNRRLQLNASGFILNYEDIQVTTAQVVGGGTAVVLAVENAATARSIGSEIGIIALPFEGLRLDAQYGINDARFTDFTDSPFGDLTDRRLPNAPLHTFSLTAEYQHPDEVFPGYKAFVRAEYSFKSGFSNLLDPSLLTFDSYDVTNFRIGLRGQNLTITAFVENAFDEVYSTGSTSLTAAGLAGVPVNVDVGPTRRFGVVAKARF